MSYKIIYISTLELMKNNIFSFRPPNDKCDRFTARALHNMLLNNKVSRE